MPPGYHSDGSHPAQHSDNACGDRPVELTGAQGQITSPTDSYGQYPNNVECTWKIVLPDKSSVRMISSLEVDFNLENE